MSNIEITLGNGTAMLHYGVREDTKESCIAFTTDPEEAKERKTKYSLGTHDTTSLGKGYVELPETGVVISFTNAAALRLHIERLQHQLEYREKVESI